MVTSELIVDEVQGDAPSFLSDADGHKAFAASVKPRLAEMLGAIRLDVVYHHGDGDYLYYRGSRGEEIEVLDMLGGFGASLFGHNHPYLVEAAQRVLAEKRPFNAQASVRSRAGLLADRLSKLVERVTGQSYVATFANSGAEAVEAALKHAEFEAWERKRVALTRLAEAIARVRAGLRGGAVTLADDTRTEAARRLNLPESASFDDIATAMESAAKAAFERPPVVFAFAGAFHGKTTGALRVTHNAEYRYPWARWGSALFLRRGDGDELRARMAQARAEYLDVHVGVNDDVELVPRHFHNVAACIVEPIQGEGGINEISHTFMKELRAAADDGGFPLIIDEIQSGMGRTGEFLASEPSGVAGDYYVFSKALGGGLAKISVVLVERSRYLKDFGYLHTSTFAEDDFSATIALAALDLVERDGGLLMQKCREKGDYLLARLRALQARFPGQLRDVRGRGLLIGLELQPQLRSSSTFLRVLSEQRLLGYFVAGFLLNEERIRVTPALSSHTTIRLEPSAEVRYDELDRVCAAFERVLTALRDADAYTLCGFALRRGPVAAVPPITAVAAARSLRKPCPADAEPIAFFVHYMRPEDLREAVEPGFQPFDRAACADFIDRTKGLLKPFIGDRIVLQSPAGPSVDLTIIAVPFSAQQAVTALRARNTNWVTRMVKDAVVFARDMGCTSVGLGGYTSIVTDNCRSVAVDNIALTSGNSLTVALAVESLLGTARRLGVPLRRLGVVGATGNIGAMLAEVAADSVEELVLIGRAGALRRLERVASRVKVPVSVTVDMRALAECTLIISASNSNQPVIYAEHVGAGPVVICDVAVPGDVDPSVLRERPNAHVLHGGRVRLPLRQDIGGYRGDDNDFGLTYACAAETILLGFERNRENFSYGALRVDKVRQIRDLARKHEFGIEGYTSAEST